MHTLDSSAALLPLPLLLLLLTLYFIPGIREALLYLLHYSL